MAAALLAAAVLFSAGQGARASDEPLPNGVDAGWKGEKVCKVLFENEHVRAAKCTFAPGVGHERHYHPPHFGYVLQGGEMQITDENGTGKHISPTGRSRWSDGVKWHEALNVGDTTIVYLIIEPKGAAQE
ncbi:MAG: cupin domain-containing protein [Parvularculaceae bacterium]